MISTYITQLVLDAGRAMRRLYIRAARLTVLAVGSTFLALRHLTQSKRHQQLKIFLFLTIVLMITLQLVFNG